ncbi:MAG: hypothetical protein IJ680_00520 [Paludibacteraceae bacterium]|nr:hypothetical protein [Paludibacteraceae bacterium]
MKARNLMCRLSCVVALTLLVVSVGCGGESVNQPEEPVGETPTPVQTDDSIAVVRRMIVGCWSVVRSEERYYNGATLVSSKQTPIGDDMEIMYTFDEDGASTFSTNNAGVSNVRMMEYTIRRHDDGRYYLHSGAQDVAGMFIERLTDSETAFGTESNVFGAGYDRYVAVLNLKRL